jgi:signal peptidase I
MRRGVDVNVNTGAIENLGTARHSNRIRESPEDDPKDMLGSPETGAAPGEAKAKATGRTRQGRSASRSSPLLRDLLGLLAKIAVIAAIALLIFTLIYGLHRNMDPDMAPAVKDGDLVVFYRLDKNYAAGDLLELNFEGKRQVRRVVAIEGDEVDITENGLVVNGAIQQEREIFEETQRYEGGTPLPVTLGEGEVFVLGDSRDNATDSRVYGPVKAEDTHGSVIAVIRRRNL